MRLDPRLPVTLIALAGVAAGALPDWWTVTWAEGLGGGGAVGIRGTDTSGGLTALLPAIALAAMLATLSLGRVGRRVVGVLAAVAGVGMAGAGLGAPLPDDSVVERLAPLALLADGFTVAPTAVPLVYAVLGGLLVLASAWSVARPPAARRRASVPRTDSQLADSLSSWKAMDEGHDPTGRDEERA